MKIKEVSILRFLLSSIVICFPAPHTERSFSLSFPMKGKNMTQCKNTGETSPQKGKEAKLHERNE